jgi:hypothetical protein
MIFVQYHVWESEQNPDVEIFKHFTAHRLTDNIRVMLSAYDRKLGLKFNSTIKGKGKATTNTTQFFLFDGRELPLVVRK